MGVLNWLLLKLKNTRFAIQHRTAGKSLMFGAIYKMALYRNWKRDNAPMIYVMYSGPMSFVRVSGHYTDGININYLNMSDKLWLARMIFLMRKGNQLMTGALFYKFLKLNRPNVIRTAYRRYHTNMINNPRMVSSGITNLSKLVYPFNDPFIVSLNKMLAPEELNYTQVPIAYSKTEIMDRITQAQNSQNIQTLRQTEPQKLAPWIKQI